MFEPKSYFEKRMTILEGLVISMLGALPPESIQYVQQPYNQFLQQSMRIKAELAESVVGENTVPLEDRPDPDWIRKVVTENLGRTVFNAKLQGSQLEGAIGSKSFGQKYLPWLKSLPNLDESWAADMATGFYADLSHQRNPGDLPLLALVINTGDRLILTAFVGAQQHTAQLYIDHVPATFNWNFAREEFTFFRRDISKADYITGLAKALVSQERTSIAVEPALAELAVLSELGLDVVVTSDSVEVVPGTPEEQKEVHEQLRAEHAEDFAAEKAMVDGLAEAAMPTDVAEGIDRAVEAGTEIAAAVAPVEVEAADEVEVAEGPAA